MKKVYAILIGLLISVTSFSQSCLPQGITFEIQAQIDNFQVNYPNCTQVEGNIFIAGLDINNLNGLSVLTYIGGFLEIGDQFMIYRTNLKNLTGLDNVTAIGGSLIIYRNDSLSSLEGLESVITVGGTLLVN